MADEDRVLQAEFVADLDHIVRVAGERGVLRGIVSLQIGAARADMIEKDDPELVLERGRYVPPHVLIAAKTVRENHRGWAVAGHMDIVANDRRHATSKAAPATLGDDIGPRRRRHGSN